MDKCQRSVAAKQHTEWVEQHCKSVVDRSVRLTETFNDDFAPSFEGSEAQTVITVVSQDTVSTIIQARKDYRCNKIAALNFASYKHPGGRFLDGSLAQEEALCHESTLYNVLSRFANSYYDWNGKHKNNGMYENRALYTTGVVFMREGNFYTADVITCAAPNWSAARRYGKVSITENNRTLEDRIHFILDIAKFKGVDTLILGAYGCGVFAQDPFTVAKYFKQLLDEQAYGFQRVIFAIPDVKSRNYNTFRKIILQQ